MFNFLTFCQLYPVNAMCQGHKRGQPAGRSTARVLCVRVRVRVRVRARARVRVRVCVHVLRLSHVRVRVHANTHVRVPRHVGHTCVHVSGHVRVSHSTVLVRSSR